MLVLAIESSCDETAAAVVQHGHHILANVVSSQVKVHEPFGGVVPELASRHHLQNIVPVVQRALHEAGVVLAQLDGIAVTRGPGLVGALLVGVQLAKALAYVSGKPLLGVNHMEGHLYSCRLEATEQPPERHLALLVSGGHTTLVMVDAPGCYRVVGRSRDDAAGEAFDKVAKLLGLGYPGGPVVEQLSQHGDPAAIHFPRALLRGGELDFSFSGLKTAVANHLRREGRPEGQALRDLCASFQAAVADVLVQKAALAMAQNRAHVLVAAGGVMANRGVRAALTARAMADGFALLVPRIDLCTDNAAMIAAAATPRLQRGERSGLDLNASARLPL